jgi:hypothetical protein
MNRIILLIVALLLTVIYFAISEPAKGEAKLAYKNHFTWTNSNIIKHSQAYVDETIAKLRSYQSKIDSKLLGLESKQIQAQQDLKNYAFNLKQLNLKNDTMIEEYKTLKALDEVKYQPRLKEIKSMILRLDSKIGTYQKKQSLLNGSKIRTSEMIDATYATKAIVEQKIDEMDLMRDEMLLNGSSATDSIDLESISELIANIESLSNHFEHKSLDHIIENGFVPQDRDQRFEEILRNEGLTVSKSSLSKLEESAT